MVLKGVNLMIKLKVNNKEVEVKNKISLEELAKLYDIEAYCAKVNNRIRELSYIIEKECEIEFLDLTSVDAVNVYSTSLRYFITMAIKNTLKRFFILKHPKK